ncbi:MAG: hypothetical protein ACD_28C00420G0007 [uncultured bacterium]|nr:MAG: hypothetical protein ACD_28C00420G0007 [uncultured bacterium]
MNDLDQLRQQIDKIDDQIVALLGQRFRLSLEVGTLKRKLNVTTYQAEREATILKRVVEQGSTLGLDRLLLQALFLQIFAVSRRDQE